MASKNQHTDLILKILEKGGAEKIVESHEGWMCCCPLPAHEDDTPSFAINGESGLWRCYGCKESGNLVQLVSRLFNLDAKEAKRAFKLDKLELLKSWPKGLPPLESRFETQGVLPEETVAAYKRLCPFYMTEERGFTKDFLRRFEIGYDPTSDTVVFPIRDVHERLVGLTRRACDEDTFPKYMHTTFSKGDHLYLLDRVRWSEYGCVFLVEGHIDALRLWELAEDEDSTFSMAFDDHIPVHFSGAVTSMGAKVTKTQINLLARYSNYVCLAFDNDEVGGEGEERVYEALLQTGVRKIYTLDFEVKDPGKFTRESMIEMVSL